MKRCLVLAVACAWMWTGRASAEIIERILAVVNGELIMLSDAAAAIRFGLVAPAPAKDPIAGALDALIDRQLQLFEVNRYLPPEPAPEAIDKRLAGIRARFATDEAYRAALDESGMTEERLRSRVRDNLRIASYRAQRFAAAMQPTEEDLLRYYRLNEPSFTTNGVLRPFDEVRDEVRVRVIDERTDSLIGDWLITLRRRADVQVLYPLT